jgi:2-dehydro-3-deoxyphosphooctonate aldolase (KDO 8-P synthase)
MGSPAPQVELAGRAFGRQRLFAICGPCVIESEELALAVAQELAGIGQRLDLPILFKASFDKANRTSLESFRGPGLEPGLKVLERVKRASGLPVISDVHRPEQAAPAAQVLDAIQVPAFLCRQTDLLLAVGASGLVVNVKKGQFVAPHDMGPVVAKVRSTGNRKVWLTERGSSFGYNNLVVDMRSLGVMGDTGCPVVFDATHSVQLPGGLGAASGGDRRFVPALARAAVAAGAHGVFLEVHPEPDRALCDGPNSWPLDDTETLLAGLQRVYAAVRQEG